MRTNCQRAQRGDCVYLARLSSVGGLETNSGSVTISAPRRVGTMTFRATTASGDGGMLFVRAVRTGVGGSGFIEKD